MKWVIVNYINFYEKLLTKNTKASYLENIIKQIIFYIMYV